MEFISRTLPAIRATEMSVYRRRSSAALRGFRPDLHARPLLYLGLPAHQCAAFCGNINTGKTGEQQSGVYSDIGHGESLARNIRLALKDLVEVLHTFQRFVTLALASNVIYR